VNTAELPSSVRKIVEDITTDPDSKAIWLIGSRANNTHHEHSDWDILVFSEREPVPVSARSNQVDVLHLGPSGKFLLEGKSAQFIIPFSDLRWKLLSPTEAHYIGKRTIDFEPGTAQDNDQPRFAKIQSRAKLLWSS